MIKKPDHNLKEYYSKRAREYDAIYHRNIPIRLKEQNYIGDEIRKLFKDKYVLELACGTGYWTRYLVGSAKKVLATDINETMLAVAQERITDKSVQFIIGDAYNPPTKNPQFTGAMACFWFSHIPKKRINTFLKTMHNRLTKDSTVLFVDSVYRKELGGTLVKKKGSSDTWKRRTLKSQEKFDILKNYYSKEELKNIFSPYSDNISITYMTHFWTVKYTRS